LTLTAHRHRHGALARRARIILRAAESKASRAIAQEQACGCARGTWRRLLAAMSASGTSRGPGAKPVYIQAANKRSVANIDLARKGVPVGLANGLGAAATAICCTTPLLAAGFGALGLGAWLAKADCILVPALLICLGWVGFELYRRRAAAQACSDPASSKQGGK
jgi:mercuric ion transport protein